MYVQTDCIIPGAKNQVSLKLCYRVFLYPFLRKDNTMARKKKGELPSGNIRRQIYNGMKQKLDKDGKPIFDENGKPVMIRDYISITCENAADAEREKSEVILTKKGKEKPANYTLREATDAYIDSLRATKSPKTIEGYEIIRDNAFKLIMDLPLRSLNKDNLQQAIDIECVRPSTSKRSKGSPISAKTVCNEWGLISSVLKKCHPSFQYSVSLPESVPTVHELSRPETIFQIVKGTEIELPVLLAMWLSFTISEIKGLRKSTSIKGDNLYIADVIVTVKGKEVTKSIGKNKKRNRMHRIPTHIKQLIDQVETDQLVTLSAKAVSNRFTRLLKANGLPHMSFHDLRHVNASVMSFLDIPDKYAMDRGGWSTDKVMKGTYMQIYDQERVKVDDKIDTYFEDVLKLNKTSEPDESKYNAWLTLFDRTDCPESRQEYIQFRESATRNATQQ